MLVVNPPGGLQTEYRAAGEGTAAVDHELGLGGQIAAEVADAAEAVSDKIRGAAGLTGSTAANAA